MAYRILDSSLTWTTIRNRRQWVSAPAVGVQVVVDEDEAVDWYATGTPHLGDVYPEGNPAHVGSGFDFYLWREGAAAPEAAGLARVTLYLRARGVVGAGEWPFAASLDELRGAGVKFGANVNREEWKAVGATVATGSTVAPVNVPQSNTLICYANGARVYVTSRSEWDAAPARGIVSTFITHPELGWYREAGASPKAGTRPDSDPWALTSGGVETWPLDQPRPWQTDVWGMWQDLIRDGSLASDVPLNTLSALDLVAAGVKFWEGMGDREYADAVRGTRSDVRLPPRTAYRG